MYTKTSGGENPNVLNETKNGINVLESELWFFIDGASLHIIAKKTGFLGFVCMQCMVSLYSFLVVERRLLKSVPKRKICKGI